jgi:predicted nuclease of predicted toxin-antitoxin system
LRFLVDAQLPPALARWLANAGEEASHVREIGMMSTPDALIFAEAARRDAIVITKDTDFLVLADAFPERAPAIIHVRTGNCTARHLLARWAEAWPELKAALHAGGRFLSVDDRSA